MKKQERQRKAFGFAVAQDKLEFLHNKAFGDEGENIVYEFFEQKHIPYRPFKVPDAITNADFADRVNFTKQFKKDLLIDALANIQGVVCAVEVKSKNSRNNFVIDVNDYEPLYREFRPVMPVKVYFYMKPLGEIFVHDLRDPKAPPSLRIETQRNEAVYRIPLNELCNVAKAT